MPQLHPFRLESAAFPTFAALGLIAAVLLGGCATPQERAAQSAWASESRSLHPGYNQEPNLPLLDENATIDDYVLHALLNNPGLRASFDRWKASLEAITPARTLPDPRFTYAYYIQEVETRVGSQTDRLGIAQTLPWLGKLDVQGEMALQQANAEQQGYESEKLRTIYQVKKIYCEYWFLARTLSILKDNITLVTHFENVARARYRSGAGLQSAVIKTQVELGKLEDRLRSQKDLIRAVVAKFNSVLNRPPHLSLPMPTALPKKNQTASDEELRELLRKNNPNLKAIDFMTAKQELSAKLAAKNYFPDLTLGLDYIETKGYSTMHPTDNGKDPVIAMATVNIPIWWQKYKSMEDEALARQRSFQKQRVEKENELFADLEMALYELRDAGRKIDLYKNTLLPMAEQNVNIDQVAFTADKVGFLDLIDSQRILLQFQLENERALADQAIRMAEVEMLIGKKESP